jgi:O-antigen/teichoic acid export membrane protein
MRRRNIRYDNDETPHSGCLSSGPLHAFVVSRGLPSKAALLGVREQRHDLFSTKLRATVGRSSFLALSAMNQSQRIAKNVLAGGLSTALGGALQLAAVLLIARRLSVAEFGVYSFMMAFAFVMSRVADMGVSNILVRDMAVEPSRLGDLLGEALALAWLVTIGCGLLMVVSIPFLPFDRTIAALTVAMGIGGLTQFHCNCHGSVLRSQEDNELQAAGFVLHKVCFLTLVVVALQVRPSLSSLVAAQLVANILQWLFVRWLVIHRYAKPRLHIDVAAWKYLIANAVPLGGAAVVRLLAEQADILILTWLTDPRSVGLFSGPYRMTTGLRFVPQAMVIALFPLFARAARAAGPSSEFREAYERGLKGFVIFGFPIAVLYILAPECLTVGLLGTRYSASIPAMRLLGAGTLFMFAASPFPYLLTALDLQKAVFMTSALALVFRVALDFALTPWFGFLGPCFSMIVSETTLVGLWIVKLSQSGYPLDLPKLLWRPAVGSLAMGSVLYVYQAKSLMSLAPAALVSAMVYFAVVLMLGAFTSEELDLAKDGAGFVRTLVQEWSNGGIQGKPS